MKWTPELKAELRLRWKENPSPTLVARAMGLTKGQMSGAVIHFNLHRSGRDGRKKIAPKDTTASLYPGRVRAPSEAHRLLVTGHDSTKLGRKVTKGPWAGMYIFSLTLEERATCPRACAHWHDCYGNNMSMAARNRHGPELIALLEAELYQLAARYPKGFVIRLHVLGDFYSAAYVRAWYQWMAMFPMMRIWGYTARSRDSEIGRMLEFMSEFMWERFAVRFSNDNGERSTKTISRPGARGKVKEGLVCPVQTGGALNCGACGLCWHTRKRIVFLAH